MKKSLMMGTAIGALFVAPAFAADLAVKAPYTTAAPAFSWTGCYIGVHVGGGGLSSGGNLFGDFSTGGQRGNGALAGGQVGCNYQTGMLVFGIEGDGFWSGMKSSFSSSVFPLESTTKNKYDYDITARLGVAIDRTYIYGKAGWVWGKFDFNTQGFGTVAEYGNSTLDGILIGAGFEHAFTNNWTAKFEYNYLNYGSRTVNLTDISIPTGTSSHTESRSADKHIIKVGMNYKFY